MNFTLHLRIFFVQIFVNEFINDYDSSSIINENGDSTPPTSWCDLIFQRMFEGFSKWDAAYFMKIAEDDYKYEQYLAFFPLFPWILRILVRLLHPPFQYFLNERSLYLAIGWILNSTLFTLAAISLYKLTFKLFGSRTTAMLSSLLFCFNPASVFMSSLYTESLFCCLQFTAMCFLEQNCTALPLLLFGLGCATRSNGVLSCGFLAHRMIKNYVSSELPSLITDPGFLTFWHVQKGAILLLRLIVLNGIVLVPFIIFQLYGYYLYCMPPRSFLRDLTHSPWCDKLVPFSYSYIQDNYWNVGFLRYFEVKQVPNFALAAPVIILSLNAVLIYCLSNRNIETVKTLGLLQSKEKSEKMIRYVFIK